MTEFEVRRALAEPVGRRAVLVGGTATAAGLVVPAPALASKPGSRGRLKYPFTLGIASGDPSPDGVVLWTRLAPSPVDDDGLGGMPSRSYPVIWQVAKDDRMRHVVRTGVVRTSPQSAHSVHVEVHGLEPGREYYYRFRCLGHLSPTGRTVTAPATGFSRSPLTIGLASCQAMVDGYFTAYRHMVDDNPDLIFHVGDYLYEHWSNGGTGRVRDHVGPQPHTLATYRQQYASYRCDDDLQAAHGIAPWVVTFDDHEIDNNWWDGNQPPQNEVPGYDFLTQRANAFQAYYEHMPLRRGSKPRDGHIQIYRSLTWGQLASLFVLDTRQYRTHGAKDPEDVTDPERSMTGDVQEAWLIDEMAKSHATWNIVLNQTRFVPHLDHSPDTWNAYPANRQRVIDGWVDRSVRNPLLLTGNQHQHYASEIKADFSDTSSPTIGTEFVGTSISTGRNGYDMSPDEYLVPENPWIKFRNHQRGYVRLRIDQNQARVDHRTVPYVTEPGAPVRTRASFNVEAGNPGLDRVE